MLLSREQVRELDRRAIEDYGLPGVVLMENAGRGCAELLHFLGVRGPVLVCCGKGNNGGDGFVLARHLDNAQIPVRVLLFATAQDLTGDAAIHYRVIAKSGLPMRSLGRGPWDIQALGQELAGAEWVVDALFGTGLSGPPRAPFDQVIAAINRSSARILAIDIPSGLDCDTGQPLGAAVRAERTATFVGLKKGFTNPAAQEWLGKVHVVEIGIPRDLIDRAGWNAGAVVTGLSVTELA
ncbi:MAG TPA: NAD(P)H-hydrate epimerase [Gemmataceae bacterium]|nr:NAD(P)H-hydrate epimerase [Gemmataceae bacterium]